MWLVRWFGRAPRPATALDGVLDVRSATGLARRLSHGEATRSSLTSESPRRTPAVTLLRRTPSSSVDARGACRHQLCPAWHALCR